MTQTSRSMTAAMICAAAVTAQLVGGKATRDALFFTSLNVTALPAMLAATAAFSILLVAAHARAGRTMAPATLVPASFLVSGLLFLGEWILRSRAPWTTAVLVYLHVSGAGPLLASGFWLIASERFSPRTAKKGFGRIAAAGTLGGLCGALLAERVAATAGSPWMLPVLAVLQFGTAWIVWRLAVSAGTRVAPVNADPGASTALWPGLTAIAERPHLRTLALLVLLGTTSAGLLDYLFKANAVDTFGPGDGLLRFFALYYAGCNLVAFVLQTTTSRAALERFGLALTTSTPSIALLAGSVSGLLAPGLGSLLVARGGESIFRGSWFRAGYELFYSPIAPAEKRAAKSIIDVGIDRLGDALGGGLVRAAILCAPAAHASVILALAMAISAAAILVASRLNRWYLRTLETSLISRSGGIDLAETIDGSTAQVLLGIRNLQLTRVAGKTAVVAARQHPTADVLLRDIVPLRTGDREAAIPVLTRPDGLPAALIPHVIPLLASEALSDYALFALRKVAEPRVGELTDALLDPAQDPLVRQRLARVFSVCVSQRAADALLLALDDSRFDVRVQIARSLSAIVGSNPRLRVDHQRVYDVVLQEVAVGWPVWESRRLFDDDVSESPLDVFVRDRASQSLAHVFTLLSLVLPRDPLQIAFRSLHGDDAYLRGTALEYLEGVLPPPIRKRLWPFLVRSRVHRPASDQVRHDAIADLLRSSPSVTLQGRARPEPLRQGRT